MRDTATVLPGYAADTSGVASALYELGGMTVIHDASGCNSTYSTFDEPRWFEQESLVFISGLTEMDAILGSDDRFINDIVEAAEELRPRFIALCTSPVPVLLGSDMDYIARAVEERTGIPCFSIRTNGIRPYTSGVADAYLALIDRFSHEIGEQRSSRKFHSRATMNLLGVTPLDMGVPSLLKSLRDWARNSHFRINTCLSMQTTFEQLLAIGTADINLVVAQSGIPVAQRLMERYNMPYVIGLPFGHYGEEITDTVSDLLRDMGPDALPDWETTGTSLPRSGSDMLLIGESVTMWSLRNAFMSEEIFCDVLSPLEEYVRLSDETVPEDEKRLRSIVRHYRYVMADPLYARILPKNVRLLPHGHVAFSGRMALDAIPDYIRNPLPRL